MDFMQNSFEDLVGFIEHTLVNFPSSKTGLVTIAILILYFLSKRFFILKLEKREVSKDQRVFLRKRLNRTLNFILILVLTLLWFTKIQVFFVSLVAVAAAIVIAFKEFIMCFVGGLYLKNSKIFKNSDRIEIDGVRGFVIESSLLSTKVLEIGPEKNSQQTTGEVIGIPNSIFLSKAVKNESYFKGYSIKTFSFSMKVDEEVEELEKLLFEEAKDICKDYIEDASESISKFSEREGIVIPSVQPRTKVVLEDHEVVKLLVKIAVKNTEIADVEQRFNRAVISWRRKKMD
ncbi:MAG: hypothetical protein CME65_02560 [Halobacteriovoraceae bacterium]|nr:hypothetical protein [Halobacteriovoraceae bacterium]|tara:strand:- start:4892 stop:5758 length:867 start_codon:yes stop_codon:yes gene_type:complete